jgi:hypothetical protein
MAVKTFSIRFGSRFIHRPNHQKIRSSTTVSATIVVIKIGHMIGPPFLKLSIRKLELNIPGLGVGAGVAVAATVGAGVIAGDGDSSVTGTDAPGLGIVPGTPGGCNPGAAGAGGRDAPGTAGFVVVGKVVAGLPIAGAAGVISGGGAS